jgi:hypothetical protein
MNSLNQGEHRGIKHAAQVLAKRFVLRYTRNAHWLGSGRAVKEAVPIERVKARDEIRRSPEPAVDDRHTMSIPW